MSHEPWIMVIKNNLHFTSSPHPSKSSDTTCMTTILDEICCSILETQKIESNTHQLITRCFLWLSPWFVMKYFICYLFASEHQNKRYVATFGRKFRYVVFLYFFSPFFLSRWLSIFYDEHSFLVFFHCVTSICVSYLSLYHHLFIYQPTTTSTPQHNTTTYVTRECIISCRHFPEEFNY